MNEPVAWNEEEFNHIAYNYRSWPSHDIKGVADRYDELVNYVQSIAHPANLTDEEFDNIFANGKRLGVLETEDRFYKAMFPTDEELESWITAWAKDLYGTLYIEPTDHQRTMAIKMARAILKKASEK